MLKVLRYDKEQRAFGASVENWVPQNSLTILCPQLETNHCSLKFFCLFGKNSF